MHFTLLFIKHFSMIIFKPRIRSRKKKWLSIKIVIKSMQWIISLLKESCIARESHQETHLIDFFPAWNL